MEPKQQTQLETQARLKLSGFLQIVHDDGRVENRPFESHMTLDEMAEKFPETRPHVEVLKGDILDLSKGD